MVNAEKLLKILFSTLSLCMICSCNTNETDLESPSSEEVEYILVFNELPSTRVDSKKEFLKGDKLYFYFRGDINSEASAVYGDDSQWHITLNKTLKSGDAGSCNVVYTEGEELISTDYDYYNVHSGTAIYGTQEGLWEYSNGTFSISAHLYPQQVKLKFVADEETEIMIKGIQPEDRFSIKSFSHWAYSGKKRPCYPQTIKINKKDSDGKFTSGDYYCVGIGTSLYQAYESVKTSGCQHYYKNGADNIYNPCPLPQVYIYNRNDIQKCYQRAFPADITIGYSLVISIPTPDSHDDWEMLNNEIKTVSGEVFGVYLKTGITDNCGYSVNFSAKKNFGTYDDLSVKVGSTYIFRMFRQNNTWGNFSAISYNERTDYEIQFIGKAGDASVSPYNYFKDITYSHFPYYDELIESLDDYN